jgi:hypothetical protein
MTPLKKPEWLIELTEDVRRASMAFDGDWPDAWIYLGESEDTGQDEDWHDWDEPLLGLPVYHCPSWLRHQGHDGMHQKILPLWEGDVSCKSAIIREFECRLADSGDF